MDEQKLAELRSQHAYVVPLKRDGKIVAVFRNVKFDELSPIFGSGSNPALNESALAEKCLLWPSLAEFHALRADAPAIVEVATRAIRKISGEQCVVDHDEKTKTWSAFLPAKQSDPDKPEGERKLLISCRKLSWPQYQRTRANLAGDGSAIEAYRTACMDAGVSPTDREARKEVFTELPYLAQSMFVLVYSLTGAADFDIEGN